MDCGGTVKSTSGQAGATGSAGIGATGSAGASGTAGVFGFGGFGGSMSSGGGGSSMSGGAGMAASGTGGATTTGTGGATATGAGGMTGAGGSVTGVLGTGGSPGIKMCTPGKAELLITDCGYPMTTGSSLAKVTFSENEVFRAIQIAGGAPQGIIRLFYNDEHAMTLGVRQVVVKTAASMMMTMDYPLSPLTMDPDSVTDAKLGTTALDGDQSGLDPSLRPMWPSLYVTDITSDPSSRAGDWQEGGVPTGPNAVFGTWKGAVRTVDKTKTPNTVVITPDKDPMTNKWNLGAGADPVPTGLTDQGYGAEARWTVSLMAGHSYRVQVLVHDGDQNKGGGDSGEACALFCAGGSSTGAGGSGGGMGGNSGAGGEGYVPPPPICPPNVMGCGPGGIEPTSCPAGTVCANGCCLTDIIVM
jgi:hypothetical protein